MDLFSTWQLNLVGYIIFSVLFNQCYKLAVRNVKRDGAATIALQSIAGFGALLLMPLFPIKFPGDWKVYILLAIACIFYALNDRAQTTIRKNVEVSIYSIINQLSSVFLIFYGLTIFHEPLAFGKLSGAALILIANIILRYSGGKFCLNKYIIIAVFANLALATALSIDIGISKQFNLPFYIMFTLLVPTLMIKIAEKIQMKEIVSELKRKDKKYFVITGICWTFLIFFMLRAYQNSSLTLITPLASTSVLLNVFIATTFFGERNDIGKKLISACIVICGVYLTVI